MERGDFVWYQEGPHSWCSGVVLSVILGVQQHGSVQYQISNNTGQAHVVSFDRVVARASNSGVSFQVGETVLYTNTNGSNVVSTIQHVNCSNNTMSYSIAFHCGGQQHVFDPHRLHKFSLPAIVVCDIRFHKGETVLYTNRGAGNLVVTVSQVDESVQPPSYEIMISEGQYRTTEGQFLRRISYAGSKGHFHRGQQVLYTNGSGLSVVATISNIDHSMDPPSYEVLFSDGRHRSTEMHNLCHINSALDGAVVNTGSSRVPQVVHLGDGGQCCVTSTQPSGDRQETGGQPSQATTQGLVAPLAVRGTSSRPSKPCLWKICVQLLGKPKMGNNAQTACLSLGVHVEGMKIAAVEAALIQQLGYTMDIGGVWKLAGELGVPCQTVQALCSRFGVVFYAGVAKKQPYSKAVVRGLFHEMLHARCSGGLRLVPKTTLRGRSGARVHNGGDSSFVEGDSNASSTMCRAVKRSAHCTTDITAASIDSNQSPSSSAGSCGRAILFSPATSSPGSHRVCMDLSPGANKVLYSSLQSTPVRNHECSPIIGGSVSSPVFSPAIWESPDVHTVLPCSISSAELDRRVQFSPSNPSKRNMRGISSANEHPSCEWAPHFSAGCPVIQPLSPSGSSVNLYDQVRTPGTVKRVVGSRRR